MWPPTRGSNTVCSIGAASRLCSGGLKSPKRSVNTENALSRGASTTTCRRTTVAWVCVMSLPPGSPGQRPCSPRARADEPRVLEHLEVLGHRGSRDRQALGERPDGLRPLRQPREDGAPRTVRQRAPAVTYSVSVH